MTKLINKRPLAKGCKRFAVTFKENKKYSPTERTVYVDADNAFSAEQIVSGKFGSMKFDKESFRNVPSGRIEIVKTKEIKVKEE